jgi:hypothetical protein
MEARQTAVQWLKDKLFELEIKIDSKTHEEAFFIFEEAKAMEKEQMIDAHGSKNRGGFKSNGEFFLDILTGEQYYNETYGN